jgi:hypothetical protein
MTTEPENAASRTWCTALAASIRGDTAEAASMMSADITRDDRRQIGAPPVTGRTEMLESDRAGLEVLRPKQSHVDVLDVRGERLALTRTRLVTEEDFLFEFLGVAELNEDGRIAVAVYFDTEDEDAALAELDHRAAVLDDDVSTE